MKARADELGGTLGTNITLLAPLGAVSNLQEVNNQEIKGDVWWIISSF